MPAASAPFRVVQRALAGDRRALARAISLVEDRRPGVAEALGALRPRRLVAPGAPHVIGLTGPPGAGKSTLAARIVARAREAGRRVAVVAVDPSSPFSGGAILGDRLRLDEHAGDEGVFVRSLASRGHLGGLSPAAGQVVDLLDAAGFDDVVVETVGVGQSELSVMEVADTVIVVLTPESGDSVQAMKAGLLEIADVFVVNKADRPGAAHLRRDLEEAVSLDPRPWSPPVVEASAREGWGIDEALAAARRHLEWCRGEGAAEWARRRGAGRVRTFLDLVAEEARAEARRALEGPRRALADALRAGRTSPWRAAAEWRGR